MNKAELLADLAANCVRVVKTTQQADPEKEAQGITSYVTHVMEVTGKDQITGRNIGWYVVDEGLPGEAAYYRDKLRTPATMYADAVAYLATQPQFIRYSAQALNPDRGYAIMFVWEDDLAGNVAEKRILLYYDGAGNATHKPIV